MRISLGIEYDGGAFHGWQTQQNGIPTIAQQVQQALSFVAASEVEVVCAGRTDKGVHARGQVVHFDTQAHRSMHSWVLGANTQLPSDIALQWAQVVPEDFHARFSAIKRHYRYMIYNHRSRSALHAQRATWIAAPLDESAMAIAGRQLLGEHDFSAFRASECQAKTPVRCIEKLRVERHADFLVIEVVANAFLHHMVRNIVGTLLAVGHGKRSVEWVEQVLQSKDRRAAGATAPPQGLYLTRVDYPAKFNLPTSSIGQLIHF